jgi:eukaryotic-like serine/threonine-protein kinase
MSRPLPTYMMCPRCGQALPPSSDRCPNCGTSVAALEAGASSGYSDAATVALRPAFDQSDSALTMMGPPPSSGDAVTRPGIPPGLLPTDAQTVVGPVEALASPQPTRSTGADAPASFDTGPLEPGQTFGPRYHIIRCLGVGGMGAVYQAWDAELGVAVAIKVIRPEILADPGAAAEVERRFKRELLLARQVTHKNVVRIHDLGEIDGIKYITMSYVDGTELATFVRRQGKLAVPAVVRLAQSVVSGLVAAHTAGVVHRDLKPANIMIGRDGEALIMDFGIARSTGGGSAAESGTSGAPLPTMLQRAAARPDATMQGTVVGTVEYMAPEQARGEAVDQRADIYAFGLILYDTLTGLRRAERAESAVAELQARMKASPPPVSSLVPEVPAAFADVISRCLEPDPDKRYQTTTELAATLGRLDEKGELIPVRRVLGLPAVAAVVVLLLALSAGTWWYQRQFIPPAAHEPVSVVIADLQNNTGDPAFDRVLEPTIKRALEGASFISAYDRAGVTSTLGVRPPEMLDEVAARQLAVREGLNVILSGSLDRQGAGYAISMKAMQTVTGDVITTAKSRAANKEEVLRVTTKLVSTVRDALGDDTSDSGRQFAMTTLSTTSLDVVRHHAAAMEASSNNKFEEALQSFQKAVELDPKFGIGYQGMAAMSINLSRRRDAEKYIGEAIRRVDGMTERERYQTRGVYYYFTGDYKACVKEFGDQLVHYPASPDAHTMLALCLTYLRDMSKAVDEMRRAVGILPKQVMYRANLSLFTSYASDFQTAEREARAIQNPVFSAQALALAQTGQGLLSQARETYQRLGKLDAPGASLAASGLGDLALYEGRFLEGARILEQGAAADMTAKNPDRAAAKFAALAYARVTRGQKGEAVAAATQALQNSNAVKIRFLSARTYLQAGEVSKARPLIDGLASEQQSEPQAYAKILEGEIALTDKDPRQAIKHFSDANGLLDTWIGHFDLGRAYLEVSQFIQADSEFDRCLKRRGEVLALFIDEEPTYAYFPPVYYYQGRAREGMKTQAFADSYRAYLNIRGASNEDPFVPEVRRRVGG